MITKPYYILIAAIALMGSVARSETYPIPGGKSPDGIISMFTDPVTGIEYIVMSDRTDVAPTIALRRCVRSAAIGGAESLGVSVIRSGVRQCIRIN